MRGQLKFDGKVVEAVQMKVKGIGTMDLEIDVPGEDKKPLGETVYLDELGFDEDDLIEVTLRYRLAHKGIDYPGDRKVGVGTEVNPVQFVFEPVPNTFHVDRVIRKAEADAEYLDRIASGA